VDFDLLEKIYDLRREDGLSSDFNLLPWQSSLAGMEETVNAEWPEKFSGVANDANNTSDKIMSYAYEKGLSMRIWNTGERGKADRLPY